MKKIFSFIIVLTMVLSSYAVPSPPVTKNVKKPQKEKKDSLAVLTAMADSGNAKAQNTLGVWYYTGKNVKQDYRKALELWSKSAQQGNPDGLGNMALCFQLGKGTDKDSVTAIGLYKKAITAGNKDIIPQHEAIVSKDSTALFSARLLLSCYTDGIGVKKNFKKAETYQRILANSGDIDQQFSLGLSALNSGHPDEAVKWFKKAAANGKNEAIYYYGYLLFNGMGVTQDKANGLKLIKEAADNGMGSAKYQLGRAYYEGNGVEKDEAKARQLLTEATASNREAVWFLAKYYLDADTIDYLLAVRWLSKVTARHEKDINAIFADPDYKTFSDYVLGLKKYFVDKDYEGALALFKSVGKTNAEGLTMEAMCLADKDYAKSNAKKALKLYQKAAEEGSYAAKYYLSQMYYNGNGMKQVDRAKALELLKSAAVYGIGEAQCELGDKYFNGEGVESDMSEAATLYLKAESQGCLTSEAAANLIKCYQRGLKVLPDLDNSKKRIAELSKIKTDEKLIEFLKGINE